MRLPIFTIASRPLKKQKPLIKGTDVRQIQQALKHLELFHTRVDGVYGYETARAVQSFQKAFNLKPTGIIDEESFHILKQLIQSGINKWSTIQKDYAHTGYSPVPIPTKLNISWTKGISDIIALNCRADRLIITTQKGVYVLNIKSGMELWGNDKLSPQGTPTIAEGMAMIPAHSLEILDVYSGKNLKTIDIDIFTSSVAVKGRSIYASALGTLYSLDENGNILWEYKTRGAYSTSPTLGYDLIYFASFDRGIYCLDEKGILYWKTKSPGIIQLPMALWDGKIFAISRDSWISALNPLTGDIIWKKKFSDEEFLMPAFHRDFMLMANYKGQLSALSFQRSEIKLFIDLPAIPTTPPIVCPDTFFIGTQKGLIAYDIQTLKNKTYLENKQITAIMPGAMSLFVATQQELFKFSPRTV